MHLTSQQQLDFWFIYTKYVKSAIKALIDWGKKQKKTQKNNTPPE